MVKKGEGLSVGKWGRDKGGNKRNKGEGLRVGVRGRVKCEERGRVQGGNKGKGLRGK